MFVENKKKKEKRWPEKTGISELKLELLLLLREEMEDVRRDTDRDDARSHDRKVAPQLLVRRRLVRPPR